MLLIPVSDDNDARSAWHDRRFVHYGLILLCFAVFFYEFYLVVTAKERLVSLVDNWSFDPRALGEGFLPLSFPDRVAALAAYLAHVDNLGIVKMLTSTFLHGGWEHVISNMLLLWILGDNVEYAMGHIRYLLFFLVAGIIASCGDVIFATAENFKNGIGASGAIMAVAGAYMVYYPRAKINFFYCIGFRWEWKWGFIAIPSWIVIGVYILLELAIGIHDYGTDYDNVGVWAHVTGFIVGVALAWPLRQRCKEPLPLAAAGSREAYRQKMRALMRARHDRWRR